MRIRRVNSKIKKDKAMRKEKKLHPYLLKAKEYSSERLLSMLKKYTSVFIKPDRGRMGNGIIRVRKIKKGKYEVSLVGKESKRKKSSKKSLVSTVESFMKPSKTYMIQRGIDLARYRGRPFDLRIIVQKPKEKWELAGILARVAAPNQFVTNYHKGGYAVTMGEALQEVKKSNRPSSKEISDVCQFVAKALEREFPGIRELGIDMGIDRRGCLWIFEVNTNPMFILFRKLPDKRMYWRIRNNLRYIKKTLKK